jgi:hypothetical protein
MAYNSHMDRPKPQADGSRVGRIERLALRLEPEEKQAFTEASELAGLSLSAWIRERLRWAATKELEAAMKSIPFLEPPRRGNSDA